MPRHGISWAFIMFARVESTCTDGVKGQSVSRWKHEVRLCSSRARMRKALQCILVRSLYCKTSVLASSTCLAAYRT